MCHWIIDQNVYILAQDPVAENFLFPPSLPDLFCEVMGGGGLCWDYNAPGCAIGV